MLLSVLSEKIKCISTISSSTACVVALALEFQRKVVCRSSGNEADEGRAVLRVTSHDPTRRVGSMSHEKTHGPGRVGSGRVRSGRIRNFTGHVELGWGLVRRSRVGSKSLQNLTGRVGSGQKVNVTSRIRSRRVGSGYAIRPDPRVLTGSVNSPGNEMSVK